MTTRSGETESTEQIIQAAVSWWVWFADEGLSFHEGRRFVFWLLRSPRHLVEFVRVSLQDESVTRALHAKAGQSNESRKASVTRLDRWRGPPLKSEEPQPRYHIAGIVIAGTILVLSAIYFGPKLIDRTPAGTVTIAANDAQSMQLTDGSKVALESNSNLQIDFTDQSRNVHLSRGKAIFDVASDARRPFRVQTPLVDILAVGTKFAVTITSTVEVEVFEGVVEVLDPGVPQGMGIRLRKGAFYRVPAEAVADGRVRVRIIAIDG